MLISLLAVIARYTKAEQATSTLIPPLHNISEPSQIPRTSRGPPEGLSAARS